MVLEHHRAVRARIVDLLVLQQHAPAVDRQQAGDDVEQRGLAAAGMADDRDVLALSMPSVMSLSTSVSREPRLKILSM
jgi:hypothetical protein